MTDSTLIPLHAWTLRNSLGAVPLALRGPNYKESRFMVIGRLVIKGSAYHGGDVVYAVLAYRNAAQATQVAVELTENLEKQGYRLDAMPRTIMYLSDMETYYATRDGFIGCDPALDIAFNKVMGEGVW